MHSYNPLTDTWSAAPSLPAPRSHFEPGTIVYQDRILIVGGRNNRNNQPSLNTVTMYNPQTALWSDLRSLPRNLIAPTAKIIGDQLIVTAGGYDYNIGTTETWISTITTDCVSGAPAPVPPLLTPLYRIDAGSAQETVINGVTWSADQFFTGGRATDNPAADISNTQADALYFTGRSTASNTETFSYAIPVEPGLYTVTLHFAETYFVGGSGRGPSGSGRRVFNVQIEGATVLQNYDITAAMGSLTADIRTFSGIEVSDDTLTIDFLPGSADRPLLAAIEIFAQQPAEPTATPTETETPTASETPSSTPTETATETLTPTPTETPTATPTQTPVPTPIAVPHYRINVGGGEVIINGQTWRADQFFTGGRPSVLPAREIDNTELDALFFASRVGLSPTEGFSYSLPVPPGRYEVRLYFAETWYVGLPGRGPEGIGRRVFDVIVEDQLVLDEFDITGTAGGALRAHVVSIDNLGIIDGALDIAFPPATIDRPILSAIEVIELVMPTPVPTATPTETATETEIPSSTPTETSTATPTETATETATATSTDTETPTSTSTETATATSTATETPTSSPTPTSTPTPTPGVLGASPVELIFNGVRSTTTPPQTIALLNTGPGPVQITALTFAGTNPNDFFLSSPFTLPITIEVGQSAALPVAFRPGTALGARTGQLIITTNNPAAPTVTIGLYSLSLRTRNGGNDEPPLQTVVDLLGYPVNVGGTGLILGTNPAPIGEEISAPLFVRAAPGVVTMQPVARFSPNELLPYGYYFPSAGGPQHNELAVIDNGQHQNLNPQIVAGGLGFFDPGDQPFGLYVNSLTFGRSTYTQSALNSGIPHGTRVYPLRNRAGDLIANAYLVGFEDAANGDYQDYVFVITNVIAYIPPPPAPTPTSEPTITPTPRATTPAPAFNGYRINAGGSALTIDGVTWSADQFFIDGRASVLPASDIENTTANDLYYDARVALNAGGGFGYDLPVPNGTYTVALHFAEVYYVGGSGRGSAGAGRRVFDVQIEGATVLDEYDINAAVGPLTADVRVFTVTVADGVLDIDFPPGATADRPILAALEVIPAGTSIQDYSTGG
jgi:hypothetical protein